MEFRGAAAYDEEDFFESYMKRRSRPESPNNSIEKPVLIELIGDPQGLSVCDLGCGDAEIGVELLQKGCNSYTGVEGSKNMAGIAAKHLAGMPGLIQQSSMEEWKPDLIQYDLVLSRFALHYLPDLESVLEKVYSTLVPGGRFIFSVQHPVLTASTKSAEVSGRRTDWIVDDYFTLGERAEPWIGKKVIKYHRTTEEYFRLLIQSGFTVEDLREGTPRFENFTDETEYERRKRIPLVLIFSCSK